jgi:hypothetical protein
MFCLLRIGSQIKILVPFVICLTLSLIYFICADVPWLWSRRTLATARPARKAVDPKSSRRVWLSSPSGRPRGLRITCSRWPVDPDRVPSTDHPSRSRRPPVQRVRLLEVGQTLPGTARGRCPTTSTARRSAWEPSKNVYQLSMSASFLNLKFQMWITETKDGKYYL